MPKCSPGTQNCGRQSVNQNTVYSTSYNRPVGGLQPAGSDYLILQQQSGCHQNCGPSFSQSQGHRYSTVIQSGSSVNGGGATYGSQVQVGTGSQNRGQFYGTDGRYPSGISDASGYSSSYGQSNSQTVEHTTDNSYTSYVRNDDGSEPKCPEGYQGITKHPTDCKKFLNCANGRTFVQDCAEGTLFNPNIGNCDFPYNVDCKTTETSSSGIHSSDSSWNQNRLGKKISYYL